MTELVFTWIILGIALVLVAAGWWFIIDRVARSESISFTQALNNLFRPDLDKSKLSHGVVNRVYQLKMRGSVVRGPNREFLPVSQLELSMPQEDFTFVQNNGGVTEFARQLTEYRHKLAKRKKWLQPDAAPVPIRITMNSRLRRLRPEVARVHPSQASPTRPISDFAPGGTVPKGGQSATVQYADRTWTLASRDSPYRFGRSSENQVVVNHEHVSSQHGEFAFREGQWFLAGAEEKTNDTKVNGRKVGAPVRLQHGDVITIGSSGPIRFNVVPDETTEKLPHMS